MLSFLLSGLAFGGVKDEVMMIDKRDSVFSLEFVQRVIEERYGLVGTLRPLPSERDFNFHLTISTGQQFTFKISNQAEQRNVLELQHCAMRHIQQQDATLHCPQAIELEEGGTITAVSSPIDPNHTYLIRLLTYLPGQLFAHVQPHSNELMHDFGQFMGKLDVALSTFSHSIPTTQLKWDLKYAVELIEVGLPHIANPAHRAIVTHFLNEHERWVQPRLSELRQQFIHNDANDYNVLVAGNQVSGIIDFGDMVYSHLVYESAIAAAYALLGVREGLTAVIPFIAAYHSQNPLTDLEIELLFRLICLRLCSSVANSAIVKQQEPENEYLTISEKPAWEALEKLINIDPNFAHYTFRQACGLPPFPATDLIINGKVYTQRGKPTATAFTQRGASKMALLAMRAQHLGPSLSISYQEPLKIVRGWMQYLYDENGRRYLDAVNNVPHVGHCHPHVVAAAARQNSLLNTNTRYLHDNLTEYATRLLATFPDPLSVCFFVSSGSEANELALRLARTHTQRQDVLVLDAAYHGNTGNLIEISPYKFDGRGGAGKPAHVHVLPLPDPYRGEFKGAGSGHLYANHVQEKIEEMEVNGRYPAAFIAESIPGVGGQIILPANYLTKAYGYVRMAGGVCIADEVQIGFGRIGSHFWAFELQGVVPDIVTLGKPMGNGHPLAAVVTTAEIAASFNNGMEYFNTFGGNPVSCAVGTAVLDVIEQENLQENARIVGQHLLDGLQQLMSTHPLIGDVRGAGLFVGIELVRDKMTLEPADTEASDIAEQMKNYGILISVDGPLHNVLKIKPPLQFTIENADFFIEMLDKILQTR